MVLLNSDRASRTPPYSGARSKGGQSRFAYAAIMLYGGTFQCSSATCWLCNSPRRLPPPQIRSHDSRKATPAGLALCKFRLLRFRSPLLTQSNFFLFLRVLRWFTSPGLPCNPMDSDCSDQLQAGRVPPFGHLGVIGCLHLARAFRSLPRPSSPSRA